MTMDKRDDFLAERDRAAAIDAAAVSAALLDFADAMDPEIPHVELPAVSAGTIDGHESLSNSTAESYLRAVRCAYQRGLPLLEANADTVNDFFDDYITDPEDRRHNLVDYGRSLKRSTASTRQSAVRQFYRFHSEPGQDRSDVNVDWPADETADDGGVRIFASDTSATVDHEDYPAEDDLDAMREACLSSRNTRRDRAFVELMAGIAQRRYAVVTLRIGDVAGHIDGDCNCPEGRRNIPHLLLNPEIKDDGDKGAIENAGRWRPILSDPDPIRQYIKHHPLSDPDVREDHGAPAEFEDCYLFVGEIGNSQTDAASHWHDDAARRMLKRRKTDTADITGVDAVERPVNPHAWRHMCYTKSQELSGISERERRAMFGWAKGSDVGERIYGHEKASKAAARFAEAWDEEFGDADVGPSVGGQIVGDAIAGNLPPEARRALVQALLEDDEALAELAAGVANAAD